MEASEMMLTRAVTIVNAKGLHARASAKFVAEAEKWNAEVTVTYGSEVVSACSIMGLMLLGAGVGATITLSATGVQAGEALEALDALVASGFGEDTETDAAVS
ncbi:phosphotransferase system, phosphocarrier protein HPr [Acetobacter aceti NRIC 0242]|uniref:HPr kinase n=1 Tax=Acetobacter aceti NBRC 14818 TaxID=887700 RepID=A0AB33IKG3_ACEAC|nr:HPr family phosphocarrier protein [Acetobacter aceti]BCK76407.1 HPr kinase [Acetobacter aceti NBRC 14818]GAN56149.1 phosphotransferase system phosphocarrier protein HPr [Acetobacter aceti NBRC 14818]GBO81942.1 phosphotransferase system, phosphocarrier protein HPr [Acetobacter aceti NRIC 0242]